MKVARSTGDTRDRRGFTLIELMVVLVVIGVVTAMIVPEMRGTFDDMLLRSTARDLVSAFGLASSQAVTVNQLHRVRLDRTAGQYFVERASPTGGQANASPVEYFPGGKGELDRRIIIQVRKPDEDLPDDSNERASPQGDPQWRRSPPDSIAFYPDGTADRSEVVLRDREGFGLALRINPTTARVRVVALERR